MGEPTLVVVPEKGEPARTPMRGVDLVLGRDPTCDVPIDDSYLSRRHVLVGIRGQQQVVVRDLGSYNGTTVNGQRIHEECFLLPGDVLKVGRTRVFVDFGEDEGASLKIYAAKLEPKAGVEPVSKEKLAALADAYQGVPRQLPPPREVVEESRGAGPQTRLQQRRIRPDDKTPIPPSVGESAIAKSRSSSSAAPSGLSREREGMRVIAQITRVLTSATDVHELLDHTLSRVLEVVPAERGIVMRLDPARRGLYAECIKSAVPSRDDQAALRLGISHTIARKVIRERVSVLVDDAILDPRFKQASSVQDLQVRSILCVPLWLGERISGLIYLDHLLHAYAFTESDRDLVVAAANLAALGLDRLSPGS